MSGKGKIIDNKDTKKVKTSNKDNKGKIIEHNTNACTDPAYPNKNKEGKCCVLPEDHAFYNEKFCT